MARRAIKTIGDVRELLQESVPPGMRLCLQFSSRDSVSRHGAHHSESYSAQLYTEAHDCAFDVTAGSAADLYRNFLQALRVWREPRRLAAPDSDEHDNVRAGPRRIQATVVRRRLCAE